MSTLRPKRSWPKRPRSSHLVQEVISSAPSDPSTESTSGKKDSLKVKEAVQRDGSLLKSTRKLVCDAEELFSRNVTLSDPNIQAIRRQVESAMPRLYQLSQGCSPSHTSSNTSLIIRTAEDFLKRFPETANSGVLRHHNSLNEAPPRTGHSPSATVHLSPDANSGAPVNISPPPAMVAQPVVPNSRISQPVGSSKPGPVPTSSLPTSQALLQNQSPGAQAVAISQALPSVARPPPVTPSPSALSSPASYPDTGVLYTPGVSRPPVWGPSYETTYTPNHLHEAAKRTTLHQKMVLFAVHDLLRKRSARYAKQPWYEPPIGLSPEELINAHERRNDPRFLRPSFGGHFPEYLPPTRPPHSPAGTPYPFQGKRSVAVGRSIPRSPSLD